MKHTNYFKNISFWVVVVFLPIVLLLTSLEFYAFNANFYQMEFEKHDVVKVTKIEMKYLNQITEKLIGYLKNSEENLDIQMEINGKIVEVFGEREKHHMIDVKILFQKGRIMRNVGIVILILGLLYNLKFNKRLAYKSLFMACIYSLSFAVVLFILMQLDFNKYFTHFHEIFFTNDLWLLNPKTDVLIQMLPLQFFINISIAVVSTFLGAITLIGGFSFYKLKNLNS